MSEPLCLATPEQLRAEFAAWVEALAVGPRVPYLWGGSVSPRLGLDCSGLVCLGARQLSTPLPLGRPNTDGLWRELLAVETPEPGDLALYGHLNPTEDACHVMVVLEGGRVAGMSGGDHTCTTVSISLAKKPPACLQVKSSHLYRKDFMGYRRIPFELALSDTPRRIS